MSPFEVLGLTDEATPAEVTARWRELASEHHPDRGGDPEAFRLCREAYEEAKVLAEQPKVCSECGGAGKVTITRGFNQLAVTCPSCRGSCVR